MQGRDGGQEMGQELKAGAVCKGRNSTWGSVLLIGEPPTQDVPQATIYGNKQWGDALPKVE